MKTSRLPLPFLVLLMIATPVVATEVTDAELLALEISGELVPPDAMVAQIDDDLAAIRSINPYLEAIGARPSWAPGELLLELTAEAVARYEAGDYHDLDELNAQYGLLEFRQLTQSWFVLRLDGPYHPVRLGEEYDKIASVIRFGPNHLIGDGDDIIATEVGRYTFRRAWGDCPAGCIKEHVWIYTVQGGVVQLEVEYGDDLQTPTDDTSWSSLKATFRGRD